MEQIGRSSLKEALATLSVFYNAQELTVEQRHDLLDLLDALAREVIFSRRHFLENVYVVAPGETLTDVSRRFNVPPDIIARINAIDTTMQLASGAKLKVVPGPFRAEVDLSRSELTIFLGDLYAGRYPVSFGNDPSPKAGLFQVIEKQQGRNYYGTGIQLPKEDPRNPYGGWWIDLGQDVCLHGSPENSADSKLGCISLSPMDASDIYGMLGRGSPVTVRK
ncbi:MAG: L,D-transpeptidase family protein [Pirellula sp.]